MEEVSERVGGGSHVREGRWPMSQTHSQVGWALFGPFVDIEDGFYLSNCLKHSSCLKTFAKNNSSPKCSGPGGLTSWKGRPGASLQSLRKGSTVYCLSFLLGFEVDFSEIAIDYLFVPMVLQTPP